MKRKTLITCIICLLLLSGCHNNETVNSTRTVVLPTDLIYFVGASQDELFVYFGNSDEYQFEQVLKNDDGSLSITGTEKQFKRAYDHYQGQLKDYQSEFSDIDNNYTIEVNNADEVNYYYTYNGIDPITEVNYYIGVACCVAYCQVFSETYDNTFNLTLNIYNADNRKLVISHNIYDFEGSLYAAEDWQQ